MLYLRCLILWWEREASSSWESPTDLCAVGWVLQDKSEDLASICSCLNSLPGNYPQAHGLSIAKRYRLPTHHPSHMLPKPQLLSQILYHQAGDLSGLSAGRPFVCVRERERKSDGEEDGEGHKCKDSWLNLDLYQPKAGHFISAWGKSGTEAESVGTHQGEREKTREMKIEKSEHGKQAVLQSCLVYILLQNEEL